MQIDLAGDLKDFERAAIRILLGSALSPAAVDQITHDAIDVAPVYDGSGYIVATTNTRLPLGDFQFDTPVVLGRYGDTTVRFTASLADQTLRLACRTLIPDHTLSSSFRSEEVVVVTV